MEEPKGAVNKQKSELIINNASRTSTSLNGSFFRIWVEFLTPIHKLSNREKDILAEFLKERFKLSQSISDSSLLDKVLMSENSKQKIKETCGVSDAFFSGILGKLKKNGVIENGVIDPFYIPKHLSPNDKCFKFMLIFELDGK